MGRECLPYRAVPNGWFLGALIERRTSRKSKVSPYIFERPEGQIVLHGMGVRVDMGKTYYRSQRELDSV